MVYVEVCTGSTVCEPDGGVPETEDVVASSAKLNFPSPLKRDERVSAYPSGYSLESTTTSPMRTSLGGRTSPFVLNAVVDLRPRTVNVDEVALGGDDGRPAEWGGTEDERVVVGDVDRFVSSDNALVSSGMLLDAKVGVRSKSPLLLGDCAPGVRSLSFTASEPGVTASLGELVPGERMEEGDTTGSADGFTVGDRGELDGSDTVKRDL